MTSAVGETAELSALSPTTNHQAPTTALRESLAEALRKLEGLPLPVELWEQAVLPARVPGYQPRWLDEWVAGGTGAWVLQGDPDGGLLAFVEREQLTGLQAPPRPEAAALGDAEEVLDWLRTRGASFVTDLAMGGRSPSAVRSALWELAGRSLVTNDHFDVVRRGKEESPASAEPGRGLRTSLTALRRRAVQKPEGRWSLLNWGAASPEEHALRMASRLLHRHGVVARELAVADPWMPPWRVLYEVLSRLELAGEVRRGYFAEGLSGAQFALPEAVRLLQEQHTPSTAGAPVVLLHSLDPANLYGSGATLDVPLLDGGTCPFVRRPGSWLVLRAGRPVLLIEQQGKKLTALPSASRDDVAAATGLLPRLCQGARNPRHKLTVEEWNGRPVTTTEGKELLEAAGFVRDYQGMTLFAVWR
jgi:ATP-dependent Lhr-like helicase